MQVKIDLSVDVLTVKNGEPMIVKGKVDIVSPNVSLSLMIMNPDNNLVHVSQTEIQNDGTFQTTCIAGGPSWNSSGTYKIIAIYGKESKSPEISFEYQKNLGLELTDSISLDIAGTTFTIDYSIQGGILESMFVTTATNILTVITRMHSDGELRIRLLRSVLDAKLDDTDDRFFVLCDDEEVDFDESNNVDYRELGISLKKGSKEILIVGTNIIGNQMSEKKHIKILQGSGIPRDDNKYLDPETLIIRKGDSVTWENSDSAAHTITGGTVTGGPDGSFDSSLLVAGSLFSTKFEKPGTYHYYCLVHPWMTGKIIVLD